MSTNILFGTDSSQLSHIFGTNPPQTLFGRPNTIVDCNICCQGSISLRKNIIICEQCKHKENTITYLKDTYSLTEKKPYDKLVEMFQGSQKASYFNYF